MTNSNALTIKDFHPGDIVIIKIKGHHAERGSVISVMPEIEAIGVMVNGQRKQAMIEEVVCKC